MTTHESAHQTLRHRPNRTTPAVICAIFLLVIGGAAVLASVAGQTAASTPALSAVADWLSTLTWLGTFMLVASALAAVIGVVLLVTAIVPGRPNALPLANVIELPGRDKTKKKDVEAVMTRRAVSRLVMDHAQHVDGVQRVTVSTTDRLVRINAETPTRYTDDVASGVQTAVSGALQSSGLRRPPRVKVSVTRREAS